MGSNGSKGFASGELDIDYLRARPHVYNMRRGAIMWG